MKLRLSVLTVVLLKVSPVWACQVSTDPKRTVYIGDSHTVGDFGASLTQKISKLNDNAPVYRYGVVGSAAGHWNKKDNTTIRKLTIGYYCEGDGLVNSKAPNKNFPMPTQLFQGSAPRVVIALGTNDVFSGCTIKDKETQMTATKDLLAQIRPNSKCVWVGPTEQPADGPLVKRCGQSKIKAFIDNLKETVSSRCTFIDSRKITYKGKAITPNRPDKLHYGGDLARHWADQVANQISDSATSAPKAEKPAAGGHAN